ncbi:MAG: serine acetyltransferase [Paludibacteraceae bacterium]|nr:serine acetyltransferase [Paludibacteraceae bacterium]
MKLPDISALQQIISLVKHIIFPGYFESCPTDETLRRCYIEAQQQQLRLLLCQQISAEQTETFLQALPEIDQMLQTDVEAMIANDPAVDNRDEVIYCYPVIQAMIHYRVAHCLHQMGVRIIPRILTEMAHSTTGIDIHPGAQIGKYFSIDHGTGVVIGETCIIGEHVTLYQGVTLGAKNFIADQNGQIMNIPRHPIIEDNVTIYSNTSVLGRITIGHHSVIGGNVWLTHDVAPHSQILQAGASK